MQHKSARMRLSLLIVLLFVAIVALPKPSHTIGNFDHRSGQSIIGGPGLMYVANVYSETVSVFDAATDAPTTSIPAANDNTGWLAYNPANNRVYLADTGGHTILVVDPATNTLVTSIPVPGSPFGLAVSPDGAQLYVSDFGPGNAVIIIDTATEAITGAIGGFTTPEGLVVHPDGSRLYVTNSEADTVSVVETGTQSIVATINTGEFPAGIAITPDGTRVYVANAISEDVTVIDTATDTVVATIAAGDNTFFVAADPAGTRMYVLNNAFSTGHDGTVSVIGTTSNNVIATVPVGSVPGSLAVSVDGSKVYVPNAWSNTISVIDTVTYQVTTLSTDSGPYGVVAVPYQTQPTRQLTALNPVSVWIGLKNSDDVGIKFDLLAEAYKDGTLIGSGQLNSVGGGSSGFNNAHVATIPFGAFVPIDFAHGSRLQLRISVRNACVGSGKNSGNARLWYDDAAANSRFGATVDAQADYYLRDALVLTNVPGPGPKKTVDVQSGAKCSPFKPFGTWSTW